MDFNKPRLIPYENTLYDAMLESGIQGKYFQNMLNPSIIVYFPKKSDLPSNFSLIRQGISSRIGISPRLPLEKNNPHEIYLSEFMNYAEISKEQFKEYEKAPHDLSLILLAHKNSEGYKEHKANLSA